MTKLALLFEHQLKQVAPAAKDIVVKIDRDHDRYQAKIHMRLPGIIIHACKRGKNALESLNSAYEAAIKQISRHKMKKRSKRKSQIWRWHGPSEAPPA